MKTKVNIGYTFDAVSNMVGADSRDSLEFAAPAVPSIPSISSAASLVELNISCWTGKKQDKSAAALVTGHHNAESDAVTAHKKLLGECAELVAAQKYAAKCRNLHTGMTMPWSDSGLRLLPTAQMFKYEEVMTEAQHKYEELVQTFLDQYDWAVTKAQAKLGTLFDPNEYLSLDTVTTKFSFRFNLLPLADAGDFRLDIPAEALEQAKAHYESYYSKQYKGAMDSLWQRTYDALSKMSERLDYAEGEKKKIFRDSLVSNVTDMIDMLDVCNITGDSQMTAMKMQLEDALCGVTPEALREDAYLRAETKRSVDAAIKALPSLDF